MKIEIPAKEALFVLAIATALCGCGRSSETNEDFSSVLRPVSEAFGQKLGATLPESAYIETNATDFSLKYNFKPAKPILYFWWYNARVTSDRTIYEISGTGSVSPTNWTELKAAVIQNLKREYGLRSHIHDKDGEGYYFGTEDRSVMFGWADLTNGNFVVFLNYSDRALYRKAKTENAERKANAQKENVGERRL